MGFFFKLNYLLCNCLFVCSNAIVTILLYLLCCWSIILVLIHFDNDHTSYKVTLQHRFLNFTSDRTIFLLHPTAAQKVDVSINVHSEFWACTGRALWSWHFLIKFIRCWVYFVDCRAFWTAVFWQLTLSPTWRASVSVCLNRPLQFLK